MLIPYHPEQLPDLVSIFADYSKNIRGLDGFLFESYWEALLARGDINPGRDILIYADDTEESLSKPRAFSWLYTKSAPDFVYLRGPYVNPDHPELDSILDTLLQKSIKVAEGLNAVYIESRVVQTNWLDVFNRADFNRMGAYQRWRLFPLRGTIPIGDIPGGAEIRDWKRVKAVSILMDLFTTAFKEHWDYQPPKKSDWDEIIKSENFEPGLLLIAYENDMAVGYSFGQLMPDQSSPGFRMAYLVSIGLRPDFQGKGWGKALLTQWLRGVYETGTRSVELDVDEENSRAVGLYEEFGFHHLRTEQVCRKYLL